MSSILASLFRDAIPSLRDLLSSSLFVFSPHDLDLHIPFRINPQPQRKHRIPRITREEIKVHSRFGVATRPSRPRVRSGGTSLSKAYGDAEGAERYARPSLGWNQFGAVGVKVMLVLICQSPKGGLRCGWSRLAKGAGLERSQGSKARVGSRSLGVSGGV
jgi:hypothetical protein